MNLRQEILDIPRALRETLEKVRPEYDKLVRRTRWGEGPVYIVGSGNAWAVGLTGAYTFESLLGWPAVVRSTENFLAYSLSLLRPRSVLLAIPGPEGTEAEEEMLEVARAGKSRGGIVLVLTDQPETPVAKLADGVFPVRGGEERGGRVKRGVCLQMAMSLVGLVAARALARPSAVVDALEADFEKLPALVQWALTQLTDAVRSLAAELRGSGSLWVAGGGFYHPAALHGASFLRELSGVRARGMGPEDYADGALSLSGRDRAGLLLSGGRCRVKKHLQRLAERAKRAGGQIFAITDGNDPEVARRAELAVLLPPVSEIVGSTLALTVLGWTACQLGREARGDARATRATARTRSPDAR